MAPKDDAHVPHDDTHAYAGSEEVVVVALGSSAADAVPRLREKLRSVIEAGRREPSCVVVDATGAADVDPATLAGELAVDCPARLPLAVVCADAAGDNCAGRLANVDGVVVAPTVRQALEACRQHRYTS